MNRLMRDSITITDIPVAGTQLVMAYLNGDWPASPAAVAARFPGVPVVWVDVNGTDPHADVLDVENGDANIATAVAWTRARLALRPDYLPVLYCSRVTLTSLFNALGDVGFKIGQHFRTGIATLDGTTAVEDMTGVTFVQYEGQPQSGGHYDNSVVYDPAWKAPAAAPPRPAVTLAAAQQAAATVSAYLHVA